jgi:hypothetical protein
MKLLMHAVGLLLAIVLLSGCASRPSQVHRGNFLLITGQSYELKKDVIRFLNRGYMESLRPVERKIDELRPYKDYDPYWTRPLSLIPKGTVLTLREIIVTRKKELLVLAFLDGKRLNISEIADENHLETRESARVQKRLPAAE